MEQNRVAVMAIIVREGDSVAALNALLHAYGDFIIGPNAFTTGVTPSSAGAPVFGSRAISTESSGTCFTQTKISMLSSKLIRSCSVPSQVLRSAQQVRRPAEQFPYFIIYFPITLFATTILCTSLVPSKIWKIFASLKSFSTGYSLL